ncbi:MAG TPA: alanine racemase [Thermomicrobiales bacterium]|nr:alanine racemase [Thermomicrobiales bacterium]
MAIAAPSSHLIVSPETSIDTPTLVVSEEILQRNIATMAAFAKSVGVNLRPHIKTHKCIQIARLQIAAGAVGVTCAKVGEAEVMVNEAGVQDVLLAYPIVGDSKFDRLVPLLNKARIVVAVDSATAAHHISANMARHEQRLDVMLEVNSGQNRSGVPVGEDTVALALEIARLPNLDLVGIMTHEGHANSAAPDEIEGIAIEAGRAMVQTAEAIRGHGLALPTVSVGSTPAAFFTPTVTGVTEMRPGTYVFNDNSAFRYERFGVDDCAARFVATVVSRPAPDRAILDTGSKSLAMDPSRAHPGHGYIVGHPDVTIVKLSEEHGICSLPEGEPGFDVGDRVEVIPNHVCPTVNLMDDLTIVREGKVIDVWPVAARGRVR